jgi:NAD(P)-dependent dehydrogenase (short-subunit alcohol dehydrogenase family)
MVSRVKSFLVTGASTGIGRATALRLDRAGHRVFGSVRKPEDGASLAKAASDRLVPVELDVTDAKSIDAAANQVHSAVGETGLDGLVNNAGTAIAGPIELLPVDDWRAQIEVNLVGQVAVTRAFLPVLRKARGRVVFLSSIGGLIAVPFNSAYNASKWGIEAVGESLRGELRPFGMDVVLVEPGSIATPIWDKGTSRADALLDRADPETVSLYAKRLDALRRIVGETAGRGVEPDVVAAVIETALTTDRPRTRYLIGRDAKLRARMRRLISDRMWDRLVARQIGD